MLNALKLAAVATAIALPAVPGHAATLVALVGDDTLVTVDTDTKAATGSSVVRGVGGRLLGIDLRPADGKLYGLFADGAVATIDPATGSATRVDTLKTTPAADATVTVDFNPVADALRVMASDGTNLRTKIAGGAVTQDGRHAFAPDDGRKGETPAVVAGAYTNAHAGAKATALYDIDATSGTLVRQDPPNDGVLKVVGRLGAVLDDSVGFDILSDGRGGNQAWLMTGGKLHAVDLATGAATEVAAIGGVEGAVRDIAVIPAM